MEKAMNCRHSLKSEIRYRRRICKFFANRCLQKLKSVVVKCSWVDENW